MWQKWYHFARKSGGVLMITNIGFLDLRKIERKLIEKSKITFCYQYYEDVDALARLIILIKNLSPEVKNFVKFQIVDDHSKKHPIIEFKDELLELGVRVFRIEQDITWNQTGARNLNAYICDTEFALFSDIDHIFKEAEIIKIKQLLENNQLDAEHYYIFSRVDQNAKTLGSPCNIYIINVDRFLEFGGGDEDFVGQYGYEDVFFRKFLEANGVKPTLLKNIVIEVGNFRSGNQQIGLNLDLDRNKMMLEAKLQSFETKSFFALRFSWHEILG